MARPTRKLKPTFDVARDPIPAAKSGWVYRSDAEEPAIVEPRLAEPPRVESRIADRPEPFQLPPSRGPKAPEPQPSWVRTGVYLMVLPVAYGVSMMLAPVTWLLGSRSRR